MSSKQRIRKIISFISPEGKLFEAKWIGDKRSISKKLALFDFVGVQGTVAQDLKSKSRQYPLKVMFDGEDHDKTAQDFFVELDNQDGWWGVGHPTKGYMELQLIDASESIEPVRDANTTTFDTMWMEPIDPVTLLTGAQMAALQGRELNKFNELCGDQFDANSSLDTGAEKDAFKKEGKNLLQKIKGAMKKLSGKITSIQDKMNKTQMALEDAIDTLASPLIIAAMVQELIQTPALIAESLTDRLKYYGDLADDIFSRENDGNDSVAKNKSAYKELGGSAILGAYSNIGFTAKEAGSTSKATLRTKTALVDFIDDMGTKVTTINDALDDDQVKYQGEALQYQYFAQGQSFLQGWLLMRLTGEFLHRYIYSARIEKRFILKVPQSPIRIVIEKYGSLGENDANLDLFYESNNISGDQHYLLPAGREVVIYV